MIPNTACQSNGLAEPFGSEIRQSAAIPKQKDAMPISPPVSKGRRGTPRATAQKRPVHGTIVKASICSSQRKSASWICDGAASCWKTATANAAHTPPITSSNSERTGSRAGIALLRASKAAAMLTRVKAPVSIKTSRLWIRDAMPCKPLMLAYSVKRRLNSRNTQITSFTPTGHNFAAGWKSLIEWSIKTL